MINKSQKYEIFVLSFLMLEEWPMAWLREEEGIREEEFKTELHTSP